MKLSRREVLKLGLGTGASLMMGITPKLAWAAQDEMIAFYEARPDIG